MNSIVKHRPLIDHDDSGHYYTGPLPPAVALIEQRRVIHTQVKGDKTHVFLCDHEMIREWGISLDPDRAWRYAVAEYLVNEDYWSPGVDEDLLRARLRTIVHEWEVALR